MNRPCRPRYALLILVAVAGSALGVPANDRCDRPDPLQDGLPCSGSTVGASSTSAGGCGADNFPDTWHLYRPLNDGMAEVALTSRSENALAVLDTCEGAELACNGAVISEDDGSYLASLVLPVSKDRSYVVRVACDGDYTLTARSAPYYVPRSPSQPEPQDQAKDVAVIGAALYWNNKIQNLSGTISQPAPSGGHTSVRMQAIYGEDDRVDEYEVADPCLLAAGDSVVALMETKDLRDNDDGTFSLPDEPFADFLANKVPPCPNEPFIKQPILAFCTGFLAAPDVIATAGHCVDDADCGVTAVVFGLALKSRGDVLQTVPKSEVYYCKAVLARQDGMSDWSLVQLDREVVGHRPLPIRTRGRIDDAQGLLIIGHPMGLPRKYAGHAQVRANDDRFPYFEADLDSFGGNSGSPVLNTSLLLVEGINVAGPPSWRSCGSCDGAISYPNETGHAALGWQSIVRATEFSEFVPRYDVYLGLGAEQLELVAEDAAVRAYKCGGLKAGTTYYWRVVAKNGCMEAPSPIWSFTTMSYPRCRPEYDDWVALGKPDCWVYPRQCHGDADGLSYGSAAGGRSYVEDVDMRILHIAWQIKEPPYGPGIASIPGGICADFAHDAEGDAATGFYRVGTTDLNILTANWLVKEPPDGPGIGPDCPSCQRPAGTQ